MKWTLGPQFRIGQNPKIGTWTLGTSGSAGIIVDNEMRERERHIGPG